MEPTLMKFAVLTLLLTISIAVGISPPPPTTEDIIKKVAASLTMYVDPLPQMPKLHGYAIKDGCSVPVHLTIGMFRKKWTFHRDLPATTVFVYGTSAATATFPGPTIEALQGTPFSVTWKNHLPFRHILPWDPTIPVAPADGGVPTVVHLHGGVDEPQSDGNPLAWFTSNYRSTGPAFSSHTYSYANIQQPGNLWYHDHALGITRANILAGLLGAVVIRNPDLECPFNLPKSPAFDLHLVLTDRSFTPDGSLFMNSTGINPSIHPEWQPAYSGEAIVVNGKAWPFLTVHRRKYRFRILNASNARFFKLSLSNKLPFTVIGSDASYLNKPVVSPSILLSPAEIFDVVIDFQKSKKRQAELINRAPFPYPQGNAPDSLNMKVMKFKIEKLTKDESRIPRRLADYPAAKKMVADKLMKRRYITMYEYKDGYGYPTHFYINGKRFKDPVTEKAKVGSVEVWEVINLTEDTHPLHIHLGFSQAVRARELVNLTAFTECMKKKKDAVKCEAVRHAVGRVVRTVKYERTWKNVVKIAPGFMTTVVVMFQLLDRNVTYPFDSTAEPGYVYHCHILDHEDNAMLRPLKLVY